jgi:hypothetical protein
MSNLDEAKPMLQWGGILHIFYVRMSCTIVHSVLSLWTGMILIEIPGKLLLEKNGLENYLGSCVQHKKNWSKKQRFSESSSKVY